MAEEADALDRVERQVERISSLLGDIKTHLVGSRDNVGRDHRRFEMSERPQMDRRDTLRPR